MQDYLVFGFSCSPFTFLTRLYAAQRLRNRPGELEIHHTAHPEDLARDPVGWSEAEAGSG